MVIRSKETRVRKFAGVFIFPTLNKLNEKEGVAVSSHPDFKLAVKLNQMEILEIDSVDEKEIDEKNASAKDDNERIVNLILAASVEDAKDLIDDILSVPQLEMIVKSDRRKSVKMAAKKKIEILTAEDDKDDDDKEESNED